MFHQWCELVGQEMQILSILLPNSPKLSTRKMVDVPIECRLAVNYLPPLLNCPDLNTCLSLCKRVLLRVVASCRYLKDTRFTELYRQYYRHSYGRLQKLYCFVRATKTFIFNDGVTFVLNCSVSRESRQTKWLIWRSGPLYTGHLHEHRHFLWLIEILLIRIITLTWETVFLCFCLDYLLPSRKSDVFES